MQSQDFIEQLAGFHNKNVKLVERAKEILSQYRYTLRKLNAEMSSISPDSRRVRGYEQSLQTLFMRAKILLDFKDTFFKKGVSHHLQILQMVV